MNIFIHDNSHEFRLEVRGTVDSRVGSELVGIFRTARSAIRNVPAVLDLTKVESIDDAGQASIDALTQLGMVSKVASTSEAPCWVSAMLTRLSIPVPSRCS